MAVCKDKKSEALARDLGNGASHMMHIHVSIRNVGVHFCN